MAALSFDESCSHFFYSLFFILNSQFSILNSQLLQLPCDFCFSMGFQVIVCTAEMFVSEEAVVS